MRQRLEIWDKDNGGPNEADLSAFARHPAHGEIQNKLSVLGFGLKADEDVDREEAMEEEEDNAEDELITVGIFLKPGDVVELTRPGREPTLAVFVQQLALDSQFYSINGRWVHSRLAKISFVVPSAINPALLQPLIPYLPTGKEANPDLQVPIQLGVPVQDKLNELTADAERIYRTNAPVLDNAYSALADASRTRMMTLPQIAKSLLAKGDSSWSPSPAAMLAVRKALLQNEFRFRSDSQSQRLTNIFAIRPKHDVELVETVHQWVRDYINHQAAEANQKVKKKLKDNSARYIQDFVDKTRRLIARSRNHRQCHIGSVGPEQSSTVQPSQGVGSIAYAEEFNAADQKIIEFLQAWVLQGQFMAMQPLHSACTSIIHAIGMYKDRPLGEGNIKIASMNAGYLLLQEIGVISPFEDRAIYLENLMLPTVRLSRNLDILTAKAELTRMNPDFQDSMGALRRDWGSITVYCIDDAGAEEIDDGISIERVPEKPSTYWIHVHVANPTAFFDKTHVLSGLAAHMTETIYTPERSFGMLPSWVSQNHFGLKANRPAITFSTLIDDAGNMLESKIQHGVIRKVVSISPTELATYLEEEPSSATTVLTVGGNAHTKANGRRSPPKLKASQLQDLRDLYAAAQALWKGRKAAGGVRFGANERREVRVYEKPGKKGLSWMPPSTKRVRVVKGDPIIEIRAQVGQDQNYMVDTINSSHIVEEMMLLGCRSAASWCAERNIPVMFRGTVETPQSPYTLAQFREKVLLPHLKKNNGVLSMGVGSEYVTALGRSIAHTSPIPHNIIGAKSYIKVTSPLRRFSDMIAHWQIEAALRYEARTGQKLNAKTLAESPRPIIPFSHRQIQESIITLLPREKVIRQAMETAKDFWGFLALMRAHEFKEAPLPQTLTVRVRSLATNAKALPTAYLEEYNFKVSLLDSPETGYQVGDRWEAKIISIDVYGRKIIVEPVRLLHRDEPM